NFDPNDFSSIGNIEIFKNPAVQVTYEPGSVFKPLTMASAIDAEAVSPDSTYIDEGIVRIGGRKVLNYDERVWGERSMTQVLEYSINTGSVYVEQQLGHSRFLEYIDRFGIFKPTNIDVAGEVYSENKEFKKGYEINFATAAFGQGIEMTPIQLVRAFSALANKGRMTTPYLTEQKNREIELSEQIISPKTASQVTNMLVSVTENGFAKSARVPGYYIAGKTGTAQISWSALGIPRSGYSDRSIQSFIGYAPAFEPRFILLVKLNDPQTKTAEYSAVPVFQKLAKYILDYYEITPDYEL
ncbi:MAG: penicillin-binding transpeptidase domain-containing protein, partial [archaeon]|nr:penicillin-binding transpeptidase domain-containing protein [archaeon]